jgi:signal transduction histidine kinase
MRRDPAAAPPRKETDESLRRERDKSDREVERRSSGEAGVADAVIEQARGDADEVLRAVRSDQPRPTATEARERRDADAETGRQRVAADVKLAEERRERTQALAELFALERKLTDQHLQEERARADQALTHRDDFLGMVAHDLRGFMGDIALRASMLTRHGGDDEAGQKSRQLATGIQSSIARMKRLVSDLLDVAAIDSGRLHVLATAGDLAAVLRDAAAPFQSAAEAKGLSLHLEDVPGPVQAVFDHDRVVQVLGNLVSNAIKFTPSGGRIWLRLVAGPDEISVTVADTGTGIPADKLEDVFERFTQLAPFDRRGLGLGLYISKCLVAAQRGRIWAANAEGGGASVSFTLPRAPAG